MGQFARQWKLRMRERGAALEEVANSKLQRLLAYHKSFNCTDIAFEGSFLFVLTQNRKSSLRWRGPARTLGIDETGVAATFGSQTFKVARYCVRKRLHEADARGEGRQNSLQRGNPRMSQKPDCPGAAQSPGETTNQPLDTQKVGASRPI